MDYYKIFSLLFMIFVIYKFYQYDSVKENFENNATTLVDDWNAINQLAQLSKKLMAGGLTIPGALTVSDTLLIGNKNVGSLLNSLQSQITSLQSQNTNLQSQITNLQSGLQSEIANLQSRAIKEQDTIELRFLKEFDGNSIVKNMGSYGKAVSVDNNHFLNTMDYGRYVSQFRIQRNNR